ncbi:hypothetical protein AAFG07_24380 [Bradyrhizobium sp. B097]|uniref:hypothetical protein n=1 Tax=Bradyrhizobium sp. B097 TaxID=3140244 RepID=UPI003184632C
MLERRHFVGAVLGSMFISDPAAAQTPAAKAGGSAQLERGNAALSAVPAAERLNELGPENAAMAAYAGMWDVTETAWNKPGGDPVTTTGLVAERRMIGSYLQEVIRPASDTSKQDIKRIDYLSFQRVEGRWKYVSIEMRAPVGIMPAYSFDRGDGKSVVLVHDPFAIRGGGSDVAGQMLRMNTVVTRDGPDRDVKNQHFILSDGAGTVWLAHRYAYARRA